MSIPQAHCLFFSRSSQKAIDLLDTQNLNKKNDNLLKTLDYYNIQSDNWRNVYEEFWFNTYTPCFQSDNWRIRWRSTRDGVEWWYGNLEWWCGKMGDCANNENFEWSLLRNRGY